MKKMNKFPTEIKIIIENIIYVVKECQYKDPKEIFKEIKMIIPIMIEEIIYQDSSYRLSKPKRIGGKREFSEGSGKR